MSIIQNQSIPPIIKVESASIRTGYAPRAIRAMLDGNTMLVGCKNGELTVIKLPPENQKLNDEWLKNNHYGLALVQKRSLANRIWAFCQWRRDKKHIIVGVHDGALAIIDAEYAEYNSIHDTTNYNMDGSYKGIYRNKMEEKEIISAEEILAQFQEKDRNINELGSVRYIGWLGPKWLIVSFVTAGTIIIDRTDIDQSLKSSIAEAYYYTSINNLVCAAYLKRDYKNTPSRKYFLGIAWNGDAWISDDLTTQPHFQKIDLWFNDEKPSYLEDFALIKPAKAKTPINQEPADGLYLSSDLGVYKIHPLVSKPLIQWPTENPIVEFEICEDTNEKEESKNSNISIRKIKKASRIFLPRLTSQAMAVTQQTREIDEGGKRHYLWVSDANGDCHLYYCDHKKKIGYRWKRLRVLHAGTQVIRAYAAWTSDDSNSFLVMQSRRNDQIVLSRYKKQNTVDQNEHPIAQLVKDRNIFNQKKSPAIALADTFYDLTKKIDENDTIVLAIFLDSPYELWAEQGLAKIINDTTRDELDSLDNKINEAISHWTYTLMGLVHRFPTAKQQDLGFQGIARWLRNIERFSLNLQRLRFENLIKNQYINLDQIKKSISNSLESNIQFVRRWGIYGANLQRRSRLVELKRLLETEYKQGIGSGYSLDLVTAEGIVFEKMYDPLKRWSSDNAKNFSGELVGLGFNDKEKKFIVLSINSESNENNINKEVTIIHNNHDETDKNHATMKIWKLDLDSVTNPEVVDHPNPTLSEITESPNFKIENQQDIQPLSIDWYLGDREIKHSVIDYERIEDRLFKNQNSFKPKIQCIRKLDESYFFATFNITGGRTQIMIFKKSDNHIIKIKSEELLPLTPVGKSQIAKNPVRVTAMSLENLVIVVGCEDGQIWEIDLYKNNKGWGFKNKPKLVDRLGTPVTALAFDQRPNDVRRIFAGSTDGVITGLQSSSGKDGLKEYVPLWSTREKGEITGIHVIHYYDRDENNLEGSPDNPIPMVIATTVPGRAIFFDNLDEIDSIKLKNKKHTRKRIPGERRGRLNLHCLVQSSLMLPYDGNDTYKTNERTPLLAIIDQSRQVRIFKIKYIRHSQSRKRMFQHIVKHMNDVIQSPMDVRKPDSVYQTCRTPTLMVARHLLEDESKISPDTTFTEYIKLQNKLQHYNNWLPPHLFYLHQYSCAWKHTIYKDSRYDNDENLSRISTLLKASLDEAFRIRDERLYKEILRVVLRSANQRLFRLHTEWTDKQHYDESIFTDHPLMEHDISFEIGSYQQILGTLYSLRDQWQNESHDANLRINMLCIKNMLDGDAMWSLANMADKIRTSNLHNKNSLRNNFTEILKLRIQQLRHFLIKGDSLLALETLRACNYSLFRASLRLKKQRYINDHNTKLIKENNKEFIHETNISVLPWEAFQEFFNTVGDYAARMVSSDGADNFALKHEIARCFALGVYSCPSAVLPLAHYLSESSLPETVVHDVIKQIELLPQFNLNPEDYAISLFKESLNSSLCHRNLKIRGTLDYSRIHGHQSKFLPEFKSFRTDIRNKQISILNRAYLIHSFIYEWLIDELKLLTDTLTSHAQYIDFPKIIRHQKRMNTFFQSWSNPEPSISDRDIRYPFQHTYEFWSRQLKFLKNFTHEISKQSAEQIRPEIVLASRALEQWSANAIKDLDACKDVKDIFEPEYTLWRETLQELERAARDFPHSSAVQQNIVLGVLGHGLLEALDEHIFEMEEIAQSLDPVGVWLFPREGSPPNLSQLGMSQKIAIYLMERSKHAESVPKNLRALQNLFHIDAPNPDQELELKYTFHDLIEPFVDMIPPYKWEIRGDQDVYNTKLFTVSEWKYLRLTLEELSHNDKTHNRRAISEYTQETFVYLKDNQITINFPLSLNKYKNETMKRLGRIQQDNLQLPTQPRTDREIPSHGLGLYLANLSASVVNWKLAITSIKNQRLIFLLKRMENKEK